MPAFTRPQDRNGSIVELAGVSVVRAGSAHLDRVELSIGPFERVALVGPSGAGKTTLLDVMSGLVAPNSGTVAVLQSDLARLRGHRLRAHRSRIGLITQHLDLALPLRVIHNVNAGRLGRWRTAPALWSLVHPAGREAATAALDQVRLGAHLFSRTDVLSGGERQRVAVARLLLQSPDLVLADEPTSSVDPRLADDVMGLLCANRDRAPWTTVVSLHDPELARRHATRILGMQRGAIAFDRPASAVTDAELERLYAADP